MSITAVSSNPGTRPIRLALLAASPMYYQVPLYRLVAERPGIDFTAIYCSSGGLRPHEAGFGAPVTWDVDLLSGYKSTFLRRADKNPIGGSFFTFRDLDIVRLLHDGGFDALWLHGYNTLTHQLAAMTQMALGRALLFREEQTLLHSRPILKSVIKRVWLRLLFSRASALYIGQENRRWFRRFGIPDGRMFFTPYATDNDSLRRESTRLRPYRDSIRRSFHLPDSNVPVILYVGRLISKKQPQFLLDAYAQVRQHYACALLIVGSGELEKALRSRVEQDKIADVHFAGFLNRSEIAKCYIAADIFALPSAFHETWGMVVNEAMNFRLPIVVTEKVGSGTDLVLDSKNGFVVSSSSREQLAGRLGELVASKDLRLRMGAASQEIISAWTYQRAAEGVVRAVESAVQNKWPAIAREATAVPVGYEKASEAVHRGP